MNEVRALSIFVRVATLGNLRKAAVDQGISPQAASHAVMQLEKTLGVRLFHRTTRKLSLTEEGGKLLHSVEPALAILSSALDDARRSKEEVAGPLRVSAPAALGNDSNSAKSSISSSLRAAGASTFRNLSSFRSTPSSRAKPAARSSWTMNG